MIPDPSPEFVRFACSQSVVPFLNRFTIKAFVRMVKERHGG